MPSYPYTVDNGSGEHITFLGLRPGDGGERLEVEVRAQPGAGPPMHVHYLQEEAMTVVTGTAGYQVHGEPAKQAGPGQVVVFPPGVAHKWWNAGTGELVASGWMRPPLNGEYFLVALFDSMKRAGRKQPGFFDGAYLLTRYRTEFHILEIPAVVRTLVFPVVVAIGGALGKYRRFTGAPNPVQVP